MSDSALLEIWKPGADKIRCLTMEGLAPLYKNFGWGGDPPFAINAGGGCPSPPSLHAIVPGPPVPAKTPRATGDFFPGTLGWVPPLLRTRGGGGGPHPPYILVHFPRVMILKIPVTGHGPVTGKMTRMREP